MMRVRDHSQKFLTHGNLYRGFGLLTALMCQKETSLMTSETKSSDVDRDRRALLATAGKFAIVVPPAMTLLLSTTMNSPAIAASAFVPKGNNGVGNGLDPQPPGNPPINDGTGTSPGSPGNQGGANK